mgnify:CR=1 FL=1
MEHDRPETHEPATDSGLMSVQPVARQLFDESLSRTCEQPSAKTDKRTSTDDLLPQFPERMDMATAALRWDALCSDTESMARAAKESLQTPQAYTSPRPLARFFSPSRSLCAPDPVPHLFNPPCYILLGSCTVRDLLHTPDHLFQVAGCRPEVIPVEARRARKKRPCKVPCRMRTIREST